ncbi:serine/threonine-protein kinase [Streptomyces sp. ME02-8801-2C]|uniref:serine/threonine-protein kinase n=1 Tax=Streptomyces sp. ME02-8801-2C TaxID=3028680 RepID=UPI0029B5213D|nr:serine/threonine-protein kinase [Streptomyces sp. ME02-8801-2C]MDX3453486.1 serine/threonine-protein kinase [Streptomyces sp. ME02-8801-2C]
MSDASDEGRLIAGRYRLTEQIGRGGMGTVWLAADEMLNRRVALKRLHEDSRYADDELALMYERTRREAQSAARIAHPNVVVVHDVVEDDGLPCIVMEYVPSTTLGALLKSGGTVSPEEAARVGRGMVGALRAAHEAGVLHRDVKPGNVLLAENGRVVLTDFGIATATGTSTLTRTGEIVGSIDYMAPERVQGDTPGPASDLWALGATLYQAVEGQPPFRRLTPVETAYSIVTAPLESMKQAGPLEPLIAALLAKDPAERPSAEETELALRSVTEDTEPRAWTASVPLSTPGRAPDPDRTGGTRRRTGAGKLPPVPEPPRRGRGRRTVLWSAVAVILVAGGTAGGLYYLNGSGDDTRSAGSATSPAPTTYAPSPVPDGYHLVTEEALGIAFPVPDGWTRNRSASDGVVYIDETRLASLSIGMVDPAGDPLEHFKDIEANTKINYPGDKYRKIYMQRTTYRGQKAAIWEFTIQGRARVFHGIELGFGKEGGREYDIYVSAPEEKWDTYRPVFDRVREGFRITSES